MVKDVEVLSCYVVLCSVREASYVEMVVKGSSGMVFRKCHDRRCRWPCMRFMSEPKGRKVGIVLLRIFFWLLAVVAVVAGDVVAVGREGCSGDVDAVGMEIIFHGFVVVKDVSDGRQIDSIRRARQSSHVHGIAVGAVVGKMRHVSFITGSQVSSVYRFELVLVGSLRAGVVKKTYEVFCEMPSQLGVAAMPFNLRWQHHADEDGIPAGGRREGRDGFHVSVGIVAIYAVANFVDT